MNQTRKVAIIGSTQYYDEMLEHRQELLLEDCEVRLPIFDDHPLLNELEICECNLNMIEWADEVHLIWDQRSVGVIFDFGMVFALRKRLKIIYLEPKTISGVMKRYEEKMGNGCS